MDPLNCLYYAFRNSRPICANRVSNLNAGVWNSLRFLSTAPIGAGDFFLVGCDFINYLFRLISWFRYTRRNFRIFNTKYFKTLKTHCINCYSLETILLMTGKKFSMTGNYFRRWKWSPWLCSWAHISTFTNWRNLRDFLLLKFLCLIKCNDFSQLLIHKLNAHLICILFMEATKRNFVKTEIHMKRK